MTIEIDGLLEQRFASQLDAMPEPDFRDVRRRAAALGPAVPARWLRSRRRIGALAVAATAAVVAATIAVAAHYVGPSPALTAGVSALDALPPATALPLSVTRQLDRQAGYVGVSPVEAAARMRLLRSDLSQGDLYAFRGANGGVCMLIVGHGGDCLKDLSMAEPGIMWMVSGGYPNEPSAVVGLTSDNVVGVALNDGGRTVTLEIVNNAFYGELADSATAATLVVRFTDGSTREVSVR